MDHLTPEVIATVVAERFGDSYGPIVDAAMRQDLTRRIEGALREAVRGQRHADAELCLGRQRLWETTESRPETPDVLRTEARHRANEAAYLADLIQSAE